MHPLPIPCAHNAHTQLHPLHSPAQPIRYMDNLVGLDFVNQPLHVMKHSFEDMHALQLQVEGVWSCVMTTLEVRGSQPKQHVAMRLQEKRDKLAQILCLVWGIRGESTRTYALRTQRPPCHSVAARGRLCRDCGNPLSQGWDTRPLSHR